jgi:lipoate---protein ligase
MFKCDLTFPTGESNLACDEALLELCESSGIDLLRFWEPNRYFVVVGYANRVETEVNVDFCRQNGIPILRRCTGGGTVLQGPGCLNYSLLVHFAATGPLSTITSANAHILDRHCEALSDLLHAQVDREGQTDLAIGGVKFSGNAQRRRKNSLLFHGSFLLNFDLELIAKTLPFPSRQPDYRRQRSHTEFLRNLNQPASHLKAALEEAWSAREVFHHIPSRRTLQLVQEKYGKAEWNCKF